MRICLFAAVLIAAGASQAAVTFDFAWVGNAGNAPDPETGFGAVPYEYAIAKTEVTNAQYAEFLNAVDPVGENQLGLYNPLMGVDRGGLAMNGVLDGARYAARPGREDHPVIFVSWHDAIRFANWMHNGQGDGDTETGAYTLGPLKPDGSPLNATPLEIDQDARYWVPTEDEWYKAAYHDASAGRSGNYFLYATGSNEIPISDRPEDNPSAVNYTRNDGLENGFNDGSALEEARDVRLSPLNPVGAYSLARSPYGGFDMNGNVGEWNSALFANNEIVARGGPWAGNSRFLEASTRGGARATAHSEALGFRIASVPEPATAVMLVAATLLPTRRQKRRVSQ